MGKVAVEELNKIVELKELVDQTIEAIAKKIQNNDTLPEHYPDTIRALAELITARAVLYCNSRN